MNNMITFEDITIAPGVRETASEDGAVLLDIEQGVCFSLNPVGLRIWAMLKRRYPIDQIVDSLEKEFRRPRAELIADICDFVAQLEVKHLICHGTHMPAKSGWLTKLFPWKGRASTVS
jgi:hypothetical protein